MNRSQLARRPVPVTQYLRYIGNRFALFSTGGLMTLLGLSGLVVIGTFVVAPTRCDMLVPAISSWPLLLLLLFPFSLGLMSCGERNIGLARHMEALAPCNRHNIGLLPEQQSLVRPSMLPPETASASLLRPVASCSSEPPSQLLRIGEHPRT
jgi:hypothetical protein